MESFLRSNLRRPRDARRLLGWCFPSILILLLAGRLAAGAAQAPAATPGIPQPETTRPELVMQAGHSLPVNAVAFSPDGRLLATASQDRTVKLWDTATGIEVRTLAGHAKAKRTTGHGGARDIAFSPDGRLLATAGNDGMIKLWEVATGSEVRTFTGHPRGVTDVKFSPDGRWLASHGGEPEVGFGPYSARLWAVGTGQMIRRLENVNSQDDVVFSSDGRWVAWRPDARDPERSVRLWEVASANAPRLLTVHRKEGVDHVQKLIFSPNGIWLVTGHDDNTCRIWDVAHGTEVHTLSSAFFGTIAFCPDSRSVATGNDDGTITIRDVASGTTLQTLTGHRAYYAPTVVFSPDGHWLASASAGTSIERDIRLWDLATGNAIHIPNAHKFSISDVGFSPGGRSLVTVARSTRAELKLWDVASGHELNTLEENYFPDDLWEKALSRDGKLLALTNIRSETGGEEVSKIVEVATGRVLKMLSGHAAQAEHLAFSRDGRWLASSSKGYLDFGAQLGDDAARIWEVATGQLLHRIAVKGGGELTFSPDGRLLVTGCSRWWGGGGQTAFWEVAAERKLEMPIDKSFCRAFAFSPDGHLLAISSKASAKVEIWEVDAGRLLYELPEEKHGTNAVAFTRDAGILVTVGDHTINLWDAATGKNLRTTVIAPPAAFVVVSPDGRWVAREESQLDEKSQRVIPIGVNVFEASTGRLLHTLPHASIASAAAFSPDSHWIATGDEEGLVRLWELATGRLVSTLRGHTSTILATVFSSDGRWLATSSEDKSIRLWETATSAEVALLAFMRDSRDWVAVTPDGLFDGSPEGVRKMVAWRFAGNQAGPLEMFFNEFYYPGLLADIMASKKPRAARAIAQLDRRQVEIKLALAGSLNPASSISTRIVSLQLDVAEAPADQTHRVGSGARDVRLFRNGSLVKVWRGDVLQGKGGKVNLEANVPIIAGENRFTAYAFNRDNVKSRDAELVVTGADSLKRPGTAYILVVGINEYANQDYNLSYAQADAQAFGEELQRQQTKLKNFANVQVIALLNRDATKANILRALARLAGTDAGSLPAGAPADLQKLKPAEPEDAVFVYYAGHGTAAGLRFYLIPHDLGYAGSRTALDETGLKAILAHSISDLDLEQAFEKVDAGRLLLVIDACNSGQALEAEEKRRGPMNSKGLAQLAYEKGMYILTAAQGYQAALEAAQLGHGFLTYALVEEGLKTAAADTAPKDGQVVSREWLDYATVRVPQIQEAQMQNARKAGRDLVFVDGEQTIREVAKRSLQRPRVFYRREPETEPLVIAKPEAKL